MCEGMTTLNPIVVNVRLRDGHFNSSYSNSLCPPAAISSPGKLEFRNTLLVMIMLFGSLVFLSRERERGHRERKIGQWKRLCACTFSIVNGMFYLSFRFKALHASFEGVSFISIDICRIPVKKMICS